MVPTLGSLRLHLGLFPFRMISDTRGFEIVNELEIVQPKPVVPHAFLGEHLHNGHTFFWDAWLDKNNQQLPGSPFCFAESYSILCEFWAPSEAYSRCEAPSVFDDCAGWGGAGGS
jgi:hypothetical protein